MKIKKHLSILLALVLMLSSLPLSATAADNSLATTSEEGVAAVNDFLRSGYNSSHYTVYDGTNEYNYFMMCGRKYTQGFTFTRQYNTDSAEVTFNVDNINTIEMTIGHLDDKWDSDKTLKVYRDGEWWQDIDLTVHGSLITRKFDVSKFHTLRLYIGSNGHYGFGEFKINGKAGMDPIIPEYDNVNDFMYSGYDRDHYTVYDGSNENDYFMMNGRKYTQGFTFTRYYNTDNEEVTFNVENVDSIEMTIGHLDDKWDSDKTLKVYRDGEWWQDIELKVHGNLITQKFNVSKYKTLRFALGSYGHYGFAEIKIDGKTSVDPVIPEYEDVNEFIESGYNRDHYTTYDGSNENNYFMMNGRKYIQGFTFTRYYNTDNEEVTFNVENVDSIEMIIGHLDDKWDSDKTLKVYRDGEWWQDINLTVHGELFTQKFNVSKYKTLRFALGSYGHYGFAEIKIDGKTSVDPVIPEYEDVNEFIESGYNRDHYTTYDGSNENNYFMMCGRKYTQGFTLTRYYNTDNEEVTFNVENVDSIEMTIGHLDDKWDSDKKLEVYRDNEWWQSIDLTVHGNLRTVTFDVSKNNTLRFYLGSYGHYGFAEIKIDGKTSVDPVIPEYEDVNEFIESGYNRDHYTTYDGTNENNYFMMCGRKYTQGFTLTRYYNTDNEEVTFNVENVDSIQMTIGHLDDKWDSDKKLEVYRDNEWWQSIDLTVYGNLRTITFDVSQNNTLRFHLGSCGHYGFAEIKIDGKTGEGPSIPEYEDVNEFIESGYNRDHYTTYDGSNENNYFTMDGNKYYQGFVFSTRYNTDNTQISYNVENVDRLSFAIGHIDNAGGDNKEMVIFKDGFEYCKVPLSTDDGVKYYTLDVKGNSTIRFSIGNYAQYGFADITLDGYSAGKIMSDYIDIDTEYCAQQVLSGDVDGDGEININDVTFIRRKVAEIETPVFNEKAADIDGDGYITLTDATYLQRWLVNLPTDYQIG